MWTIPPISLYVSIFGKLNDKYGPDSYNVESLRSKFQRIKVDYKIYSVIITNSGLNWDKETKTVNCSPQYKKDYAKGISYFMHL